MTVLNLATKENNMKKEPPVSQDDEGKIDKCYITKFESVLIAMILTSVLLYTTHLIITSYSTRIPDFCYLEKEPGLCRGYFEAWYFDPTTATCKPFIYGGCGGNENQFDTEEDCLVNCTKKAFSLGLTSKNNVQ